MAEGEQDQEDKSEAPSQKRIDDAYKDGNVPKSQELGTWFVMFGSALALAFAGSSARNFSELMTPFLARPHELVADPSGLLQISTHLMILLAGVLAGPVAVIAGFALFGSLVQHRVVASMKSVKPQFSRVSPLAGFKRVFGTEALISFVKTILKFLIVGGALVFALWPRRDDIARIIFLNPASMAGLILDDMMALVIAMLIAFGLVAGGDYLFQRLRWYNKLKMTRHDMKEEFKQQEGSPEIKMRLRQLRRKMSQQSIRTAVPKATLVVTNPTHFAVALQYEDGMQAPRCVAKGVDHLALRIRGIAEESGVPVIEDPPLARALHRLVEVNEEIPLELYKPVAEIIGYVLRLNRSRSRPGPRRPE